MRRNPLHAAALAAALLAATGTAALAQGTPATSQETPGGATANAGDNDDEGFDLGWLGLIGLAGLAGLTGRKRDHVTHVDTVNRPRV